MITKLVNSNSNSNITFHFQFLGLFDVPGLFLFGKSDGAPRLEFLLLPLKNIMGNYGDASLMLISKINHR